MQGYGTGIHTGHQFIAAGDKARMDPINCRFILKEKKISKATKDIITVQYDNSWMSMVSYKAITKYIENKIYLAIFSDVSRDWYSQNWNNVFVYTI